MCEGTVSVGVMYAACSGYASMLVLRTRLARFVVIYQTECTNLHAETHATLERVSFDMYGPKRLQDSAHAATKRAGFAPKTRWPQLRLSQRRGREPKQQLQLPPSFAMKAVPWVQRGRYIGREPERLSSIASEWTSSSSCRYRSSTRNHTEVCSRCDGVHL